MAYTAAIYILLCLMIGFFGRWSRLGYWGVVLVSLAVTPAITGLCLLFLSDRSLSAHRIGQPVRRKT